MYRRFVTAVSLLAAALLTMGCSQPAPAEPPDTRAQDEMAIRDAEKAWVAASQAKDPDKFAAFYTDDAVLMLPDAPEMSGKAAIHDAIASFMKDPAFALSFETKAVEVARSGDMAYELSTHTITSTDAKTRKPVTGTGHGVIVWKKQADGSWRVRVDVPVSDPPPQATAAEKK
jgi:uncharacterized protein (TIGR02246 family)